jgi:hypothetical protein
LIALAVRRLLQHAVQLLRGEFLVDALDRGQLARQPIERRFVDLTLSL